MELSLVGVDTAVTSLRVGAVWSNTTVDPLVVLVTVVPAFVLMSVKATLRLTDPSESLLCMVYRYTHVLPDPELRDALCPAMSTVGVLTFSEKVKSK